MTYDRYEREFTQKAQNSGYSAEVIDKCLHYAKPLLEKELPVIYNSSHLAGLVGFNKSYINRAVYFTSYYYRHFKVKKHNGTWRNISEPLPNLKEIQHWILKNILYRAPVSKFAKAYIPSTPLTENAVWHRNQQIVLAMDILDFFPSISKTHIQNIFERLGYAPIVANLLSKLCTLNNVLPQGAPTSPYLSNILLKSFDEKIGHYCVKKKLRYTRYADDLTISGEFDVDEIKKMVCDELSPFGFQLNQGKTQIMNRAHRQIVTGIVVNDKLQAPRYLRKRIRQEIHYIKRFSLADHMKRRRIEKNNYLKHLLGEINFVLQVNPEDNEFLSYKTYLTSLIINEVQ